MSVGITSAALHVLALLAGAALGGFAWHATAAAWTRWSGVVRERVRCWHERRRLAWWETRRAREPVPDGWTYDAKNRTWVGEDGGAYMRVVERCSDLRIPSEYTSKRAEVWFCISRYNAAPQPTLVAAVEQHRAHLRGEAFQSFEMWQREREGEAPT